MDIDPRIPSINDPFDLIGCNELAPIITPTEEQILRHILRITCSDYQMRDRAYASIECMWKKKWADAGVAPPPILNSVTPEKTEMISEGEEINVTAVGQNIMAGAKILCQGVEGTDVTVTPPSQIIGKFDFRNHFSYITASVQILNPNGLISNTLTFQLSHLTPTIFQIISRGQPITGCVRGETFSPLTVKNNDDYSYDYQSSIVIDGFAIDTDFVSQSELHGYYKFDTPGVRNIQVTSFGKHSAIFPFTVTDTPIPSLTSIAPTSGTINGSVPFTINGTGFTEDCIVNIGVEGSFKYYPVSTMWVSTVRLDARFTPPGPAGQRVEIWVRNKYGTMVGPLFVSMNNTPAGEIAEEK